jgi:hypothetical protein
MASTPIYNWPTPDNTGLVKNGALDMRSLGNAIDTTMATMVPKTIVDAKGDLIAATAADTTARLAVGANGETLVADSSTSTGLRYQGNYAAGKNKIINGDFYVNQRNFTSTTNSDQYGLDRWAQFYFSASNTTTYSSQTFTTGAAPVAGYEGKNFARQLTSGQANAADYAYLYQKIESVRTFAGQTITVSFWAKAASATPKVSVEATQFFGSGGSPSSVVRNYIGQVTLSTSWTRYSVTATIASINGKTIGTAGDDWFGIYLWTSAGSDYASRTNSLGIQNGTFDFWGVQAENGSVATAFQTATGTIQGELAACKYYYDRRGGQAGTGTILGVAMSNSAGNNAAFSFPITMRVAPTSIDHSGLRLSDTSSGFTVSSVTLTNATSTTGNVNVATTGMTGFRSCYLDASANGNFIAFSAEL